MLPSAGVYQDLPWLIIIIGLILSCLRYPMLCRLICIGHKNFFDTWMHPTWHHSYSLGRPSACSTARGTVCESILDDLYVVYLGYRASLAKL